MADPSLTPVSSVGISPDARLIVAASGDSLSVIAVPEVPFHENQLAYTRLSVDGCKRVSTPSVSSLCFPGQSTVYVASSLGHFSRYRVELLGEPVCEYTVSDPHGREVEVTGIASVGAGSIIATSGKDGVIRCWDPETRQSIARLSGHKYEVRAVAVAESVADGETVNVIASAGRDKTVRLWDVRASESNPIHVFSGHSGWVHDVAISAGGGARTDPVVLSCAGDKTVRVWNLTMMKQELVLTGHEYRVWSVAVASDGSYALSGSTDATVRAWNMLPDVLLEERGAVLRGHHDSVLSVAVSRNCAMSASGCEDGSVYVWNTSTLFGRKAQETAVLRDAATTDHPEALTSNGTVAQGFNDLPVDADSAAKSLTGAEIDESTAPSNDPVDAEFEFGAVVSKVVIETSLDDAVVGGEIQDIGRVVERSVQASDSFGPLIDLTDTRDPVETTREVRDVVDGMLKRASSNRMVADRSLPDYDAAITRGVEQRDAEIESLTRQLRAAENLAKSANAQALESSMEFVQPTPVHTNAPQVFQDKSATVLRDINDRIRRLSARVDEMVK
jgi:WD domain, G-beta repeat